MDYEQNGRIGFDKSRPEKTISREDAEELLRLLYERHRGTFGALLAEVVTGERFTRARAK
jgi:hypothetical protein